MSTEPFESDVPTQPRGRHEHGGASMRPNDDLRCWRCPATAAYAG
jgi:hypothetical protein